MFKVAVVGAAGEKIARVVEAAGIPVDHRDVDDDLVFGDADFVIEAGPEDMEVKQRVFAALDAGTPGHAVLASSTASLSITELADATLRPDKVVGFHFAGRRLVEIVEGDETSAETLHIATTFAGAIRRTGVRCAECPGFVFNRIMLAGASVLARSGSEVEFLAEHGLPGLDGRLAHELRDAYGERFYVR